MNSLLKTMILTTILQTISTIFWLGLGGEQDTETQAYTERYMFCLFGA